MWSFSTSLFCVYFSEARKDWFRGLSVHLQFPDILHVVLLSVALSYQLDYDPKAGTVSSAPWCSFHLEANAWSQVSVDDSLRSYHRLAQMM